LYILHHDTIPSPSEPQNRAQNGISEGSEGSEGIIRTLPEEDNKKNYEDDKASRLREYDRASKESRKKSKEASG
jgi:hypothetical protein